jgi:hypothetical protein
MTEAKTAQHIGIRQRKNVQGNIFGKPAKNSPQPCPYIKLDIPAMAPPSFGK